MRWFGRGLEQILADAYHDIVFGEATNAEDAIQLVDQGRLGRRHSRYLDAGPERARRAQGDQEDQSPRLPVLILSIHPEDQYATRVLRAGASGYMTKETAPEELLNAINKVIAGGKYVSAALAEKLAVDLETEVGETPAAQASLGPGVRGAAPHRVGAHDLRDRGEAVAERQDDQHLPGADPREDGSQEQRRARPVRDDLRAGRLAPGQGPALTNELKWRTDRRFATCCPERQFRRSRSPGRRLCRNIPTSSHRYLTYNKISD